MDEIIINYLNSLGIIGSIILIFLELLAASLCAGLIGYEREMHGHAAGLRTHILVSIGSCLIMIVSISAPGLSMTSGSRDPARLAAQVVSGIGFLGAGTIIQNGTNIKGLTTAATIWICGGIGLACGSGYFSLVVIATILSYIILVFLTKIEYKLAKKNPRIVMIVNDENVMQNIFSISKNHCITILDIKNEKINKKGNTTKRRVFIRIKGESNEEVTEFANELRESILPEEFKLIKK